MQALPLLKLGQIYRAELQLLEAISEFQSARPSYTTHHFLTELFVIHQGHVAQLDKINEVVRFSPASDVELPDKLRKLVAKNCFPERLLFSWLHEFGVQLLELYKATTKLNKTFKETLPTSAWKQLQALEEQQSLKVVQLTDLLQQTTKIIAPSVWYS